MQGKRTVPYNNFVSIRRSSISRSNFLKSLNYLCCWSSRDI